MQLPVNHKDGYRSFFNALLFKNQKPTISNQISVLLGPLDKHRHIDYAFFGVRGGVTLSRE